MRAIWYFDFISPFAWLHWHQVRRLSQRLEIELRPILFAGLLDRNATRGPGEIPAKREFTYRFVQWQAQRDGVPLRFPPAHPFNPLPALRLCIAAGVTVDAVDAIFSHLWRDGKAGDSADALRDVARQLGIDNTEAALARPDVKEALRRNFESAVADRVFGVPTLVCEGQLFWGNDATPMFEQWLDDPGLFDTAGMRALARLPVGLQRA